MHPTLYGLRIVVVPDRPKRQLSERVCEVLAPAFIDEMNAWLHSFFGTWNQLNDGQLAFSDASRVVYVNPRTFEEVKKAAGPALRWPDPLALRPLSDFDFGFNNGRTPWSP